MNNSNIVYFHRLSITGSIPVPVMCGVMELSCMRYGVWDTNLLKMLKIIRFSIFQCVCMFLINNNILL